MKNIKEKTALITGASSGIGEAFAYEMAKQGIKTLVITARSEDKLTQIAEKISKQYKTKVYVVGGDLSKPETASNIFQYTQKMGLTVDILVNNAGFGKWANFLDEKLGVYEEMIALNITSLISLTYLFLPNMLRKKEGGIINIASTGAFQPCPYIATYCASKAFVLSFSEALHGEYHKKGITINALCPGNTATGFQAAANADTKGMTSDSAETVAKQGITSFLKGSSYKIIGASNYFQSLFPRLLPRKTVINVVANMMNQKVNA